MKPIFLSVLVASSAFAQLVPWVVETSAIPSSGTGDPSFVYVPRPPTTGVRLIVGTDPFLAGVFLWEPGQPPTILPVGLVKAADARGPMLVVTSSTGNTVLVFHVSSTGTVTQLDTGGFTVPTPGFVALAQGTDGGFELWVDTSSQTVEHFAMSRVVDGGVTFRSLSTFTVPETPTGLAVDDRRRRLYVAQPSLGVLTVEPNGNQDFLISIDAGQLGVAVGGLDLFLAADGGALVFSAAPTEERVMVHAHAGTQAAFLAALQFGDTDGGAARLTLPLTLDVFEQPLPGFPKGLLVIEDNASHNYKVVSLEDVDAVFPLPAPFGAPPADADAGVPDAGMTDAGATDGGAPADGGTGGGGGSSGSGGGSGRPSGPGPGVEPTPACGCTGGPFAMLPALLLLWWIRRLRS